jgi:GntR family transcriptional regulator, transcriptional repressor for pyruvate dehydrogenase complex
MTLIERRPVRIPKAAVVVAGSLRRSIVRGDLQPGDPLPNETALMELYDVSRPVVREALRIIESEALISVKRGAGGGARVRRPDVGVAARHTALLLQLEGTTLADLFEARAILEPEAVRRLALRHSRDDVRQLRRRHREDQRHVDDPAVYAVHAARFHEELIELSGNKTLAVLGRQLLEIVESHNRATLERTDDAVEVLRGASDFHGRLIDLIEAGDAEAAEAHWRQHLDEAAAVALERLGPTTIVDLLGDDADRRIR